MKSKHVVLFAMLVAMLTFACGETVVIGDNEVVDAGTVKCDDNSVPGDIMTTGCCLDGSIGYLACRKDGTWSDCFGCLPAVDAAPQPDAEADAQVEASADADAAIDSPQIPTIEVALAQDTPVGESLCQNAASVQTFGFTIKAIDQNALFGGIYIQRTGFGSASEIVNLRLEFSGVFYLGKLVDQASSIWHFDTYLQTLKPSVQNDFVLYADFKGKNGQHAFQILDAKSLDLPTPTNVIGSFPVKGNTFSIGSATCGGLSIALANEPASSTVAKGSFNVDSLAIRATAKIDDMQIQTIPIKCQASINGAPYAAADCEKRVVSLAVFDGVNPIGNEIQLNAFGKGVVNASYIVPNGATKTLTIKATFATTASLNEPYDKVSIGLDTDMLVTDMLYNDNVTADIGDELTVTQLSQAPLVTMTIVP